MNQLEIVFKMSYHSPYSDNINVSPLGKYAILNSLHHVRKNLFPAGVYILF